MTTRDLLGALCVVALAADAAWAQPQKIVKASPAPLRGSPVKA